MSISVIIPAYNAAAFIAETLTSALQQTFRPDEVLVIDDGSTDDTAAIASSFPPPVRVISIANSKLGAARNLGVQQAIGDWIAFLDADDLWKKNKLEHQIQELSRNPSADICYTGRVKFTMKNGAMQFGTTILGPPASEIHEALLRRCTFIPSSVIIRKSTLLAIGGFHPDPGIAEDWELWLRLLHAGIQFASCPEPLLLYRIHQENITADGMKLLSKNWRTFREQVLPHLSGLRRLLAINRFLGENQAAAAFALRKQRDPRCLSLMVRSILHLPFGEPYRYRALLHIVYTRLTGGFIPLSVNQRSRA